MILRIHTVRAHHAHPEARALTAGSARRGRRHKIGGRRGSRPPAEGGAARTRGSALVDSLKQPRRRAVGARRRRVPACMPAARRALERGTVRPLTYVWPCPTRLSVITGAKGRMPRTGWLAPSNCGVAKRPRPQYGDARPGTHPAPACARLSGCNGISTRGGANVARLHAPAAPERLGAGSEWPNQKPRWCAMTGAQAHPGRL
jgi:hypothetical protein